jgi:hypothetical protein
MTITDWIMVAFWLHATFMFWIAEKDTVRELKWLVVAFGIAILLEVRHNVQP